MRSLCGGPLFGLALILGLAGCASPAAARPIPSQRILLKPDQTVRVEANVGTINVQGSADTFLTIAGTLQVPDRTDLAIEDTGSTFSLVASLPLSSAPNPRNSAIILNMTVPDGVTLVIESDQADVNLSGASGSVRVNSVAGNIGAEGLSGEFYLRTGRGDLQVTGVSGELRAVSEHGAVSIRDASGSVSSNNIMGSIHFTGTPGEGDRVHLETDHGAVELDLGQGSSLQVTVNSTSGNVTCPPGIPQTVWGCTGTLNAGSGWLDVRTVSGPVTIRHAPGGLPPVP